MLDGPPLRVALLAPPWIPVPPPAYGGIEAVVALLSDELSRRGHSVTLFAAPGSQAAGRLCTPLAGSHADGIGSTMFESDHVACAYAAVDVAALEARPFDVIHDHSGFTAVAMADRVCAPVVHTLHAPFDASTGPFYERHGHKVRLVAISRSQLEGAPPRVRVAGAVSNPMCVADWPFTDRKDQYLLWIGRMDPVKGAHHAIAAARASGRRLVLAGPIQSGQREYFASEVEPHLDGEQVAYVGEVGGIRRKELFAHASALLMPIRWAEPFGMVMVEALACGTPVIAFPEGAAREIVLPGENGYLVADEGEMAAAAGRLHLLSASRCRESVARRYDVGIVVDGYEDEYRLAIERARRRRAPLVPPAGALARRALGAPGANGAARPAGLRVLSEG